MRYVSTDEHIHQLSQTIAKVNRTFVPKKDDDSHTNFYFDEMSGRLLGRWVNTTQGSLVFALNLESYQFEWLSLDKSVVQSYAIHGKSIKEFEAEIERGLSVLGLEASGFTDDLHFEITDYDFKNEAFNQPSDEAMDEWMEYRSMANQVCTLLSGYANTQAEVRIWPHHFDTGVYFEMPNGLGVGFGLAMKDSILNAPYLYMSAYPNEGSIDYSNAPELGAGQWYVSENFTGALLNCDKTLTQLQGEFPEYMTTAYEWLVKQTL